MSEEESQPAPLRLKPRQRSAADSAAQPPAAPTPTPAPTGAVIPPPVSPEVDEPGPLPSLDASAEQAALRPKFRSKPRLSISQDETPATAETPAAASAPSSELGAIDPLPSVAPAPQAADGAAMPAKLRLQTQQRPVTPEPPAAASPPPLPPPAAASSEPALPPPPPAVHVLPPVASEPSPTDEDGPLRPPDHLVPHLSAPLPISEINAQIRPPVSPASLRAKKKSFKGVVVFLVVAVILVGGIGYAGREVYQRFFAKGTPTAAEVAAMPAKLIEKAQAVVAESVSERRSVEQARIDALSEGKEAPPPPTPETAPKPPAPPTGSVTAYSPSTPATPEIVVTPEAPPPGPEFIAFIDRAVIGGVFQGTPPRAFINGRTVRAGEVVDERLAIMFVGLDESRRKLIFRDGTGAEIIRKF